MDNLRRKIVTCIAAAGALNALGCDTSLDKKKQNLEKIELENDKFKAKQEKIEHLEQQLETITNEIEMVQSWVALHSDKLNKDKIESTLGVLVTLTSNINKSIEKLRLSLDDLTEEHLAEIESNILLFKRDLKNLKDALGIGSDNINM